jgi:VWFA-related protein
MKGHSAMKTVWILLCSCCLWLSLKLAANDQIDATTGLDSMPRIEAGEIRLDAVVVDKNGRQATDLTSDDFEVYQNNQRQKIQSCRYVPDEKGHRRIMFVVDDLSMNFEEINRARMAIQRFVELQKQPDDQIAIVQTSGGIGALQLFSSDRQALLSAIKNIKWSDAVTRADCGFDGCKSDEGDASIYYGSGANAQSSDASRYNHPAGDILSTGASLELLQTMRIKRNAIRAFGSQLAALQYCVHALRDLPGRKSLLLMSSRTLFRKQDLSIAKWSTDTVQSILQPHFNLLADEAFRAAVVVHTLEMRPGANQFDARPPYDQYLPYSKKTGGMVASDSNFFSGGLGPIEEQLRGFYLISYIPPRGTTTAERRAIFHQIRINIKKKGYEARYRDVFSGTAISTQIASAPQANELLQAINSPFRNNALKVSLHTGYAHASKFGYVLRAWMHFDVKDLTFSNEKDGGHSLALEFAIFAADCAGGIQDSRSLPYAFKLSNEDYARVQAEGINFETYLILKAPGSYFVRGFVRDRASAKSGSTYQYLEIPFVKDPRLLLSSFFPLSHSVDTTMLLLGDTQDKNNAASLASRLWLGITSPVVRRYMPGENFDYRAIAYNAKTKDNLVPRLESQVVLIKDGREFYRGNRESIAFGSTSNPTEIPIAVRFALPNSMDEGDYVLQLYVTDMQAKEKSATAAQSIGFEIRKKEGQ